MNTNLLKIFSGDVIISSKLPPDLKMQLIEYIENASDYQVKRFLLYTEITKDTNSDLARSIVDNEFNISDLPEKVIHFSEAGGRVAKLRKTYSSVWAAANTVPIWMLYRKIRSIYDDCTKKCGKYELNTSRRQHCMVKCKAGRTKIEKDLKTLEKSRRSFKKRGSDIPE